MKSSLTYFSKITTIVFLPLFALTLSVYSAFSQQLKMIKGTVVDAEKLTPLSFSGVELIRDTIGEKVIKKAALTNLEGQLVFIQDITEEYAWENDVFVIKSEEFPSSNQVHNDQPVVYSNHLPPTTLGNRANGHAEYAGLIQVTDMGAIEPWTSGKFEFKIRIVLTNGTVLFKDFDQVKRKYFKDQKWFDYHYFVATWNASNIGTVMQEGWLEDDGGDTNEITYTSPVSPTQPFSLTVKAPSRTKDDILGNTIVQFNDPLNQIYDLSHMKFKRQ